MIKLLYIDLFCGAGGTSTGVNSARLGGEQCAKVKDLLKVCMRERPGIKRQEGFSAKSDYFKIST